MKVTGRIEKKDTKNNRTTIRIEDDKRTFSCFGSMTDIQIGDIIEMEIVDNVKDNITYHNIKEYRKIDSKGNDRESISMLEIIKQMNKPKIELGISEKRSIAQYESKEYTIRVWLPYDAAPGKEELTKIMDSIQSAIDEQQKKDGIKPLRQDESLIDRAFKDKEAGK